MIQTLLSVHHWSKLIPIRHLRTFIEIKLACQNHNGFQIISPPPHSIFKDHISIKLISEKNTNKGPFRTYCFGVEAF